ncbi:hypothetical protein [Tropicimonas sp. S265A]|uniref:hypothetical protein n=1 Tax=Tropicimonas sp. S265A TaxID=3415134 RepID=UPI003C7BA114
MFPFVRVFSAACLYGAVTWAPAAVAQTPWQSYSNDQIKAGAAVCPTSDAQTGNFFCFALACSHDGPRAWTITYAGGASPGGAVQATLSINGRRAADFTFMEVPRPDYVELQANWEADRDALLSDQLVGGGSARLTLAAPNWTAGYDFSLAGAQAPIVNVVRTCPLPPPPAVMDPVARAQAEAAGFCQQMGGALKVSDDLVSKPDLNGDGREDLVVNWGALGCTTGAMSPYCGSAGCVHGLFVALETGGYKELLETNIRGYEAQTMPVITLHLHGGSCGGVGADRCVKYFTLDEALDLDELD